MRGLNGRLRSPAGDCLQFLKLVVLLAFTGINNATAAETAASGRARMAAQLARCLSPRRGDMRSATKGAPPRLVMPHGVQRTGARGTGNTRRCRALVRPSQRPSRPSIHWLLRSRKSCTAAVAADLTPDGVSPSVPTSALQVRLPVRTESSPTSIGASPSAVRRAGATYSP